MDLAVAASIAGVVQEVLRSGFKIVSGDIELLQNAASCIPRPVVVQDHPIGQIGLEARDEFILIMQPKFGVDRRLAPGPDPQLRSNRGDGAAEGANCFGDHPVFREGDDLVGDLSEVVLNLLRLHLPNCRQTPKRLRFQSGARCPVPDHRGDPCGHDGHRGENAQNLRANRHSERHGARHRIRHAERCLVNPLALGPNVDTRLVLSPTPWGVLHCRRRCLSSPASQHPRPSRSSPVPSSRWRCWSDS